MTSLDIRKRGSSMALAIALATGSAVVSTALFPAEAHAQRKKKDDKENEGYSNAFISTYQPLNEAVEAEGADVSSLIPQLKALPDLAFTNDEKFATGGLLFNSGIKTSDQILQLQGMELMLASGRVPLDQVGRYNFIAYQLSNAQKDFPKARTYLQQAINNNFSTASISSADLQIALAESYFAEGQNLEGLNLLETAISSRKNQGLEVEEQWYRRGLTVAYNNQIVPQVYDFTSLWIADFSSPANWRDAVNLTRNLNNFGPGETLDLLRLSKRTGSLRDKQDYILYVESADPRRLPKEVKELIEEAYAKDAISRDDIYIADSFATANSRIASDRADLPALERDADASSAQLRTVVAAAGAFLSYGQYDKAVKFYQKALGMPGVDSGEALNRLGMAQIGMGDFDGARETLKKVDGARAPIAKLWIAYANEQSAPAKSDEPSLSDLMEASS